jgi:phosphoadenosine phosphosulfate reductase family protein
MTNDFILEDRFQKIRQIIGEYGEDNFAISFSGGKDSTVLSALVDMAIPGNVIPRVFADTGIELKMIKDFVLDMQKTDDRIVVIEPSVPIRKSLERDGYPFKSKHHAYYLERFNRIGMCDSIKHYLGENVKGTTWGKRASCLSFRGGKLKAFQPMAPLTEAWEEWFIKEFNIKICDIYKPPYNFKRTGCKGCPFALKLQNELDTLEKFFPAERKQCEAIWKPVYDEYRRLRYRLKDD